MAEYLNINTKSSSSYTITDNEKPRGNPRVTTKRHNISTAQNEQDKQFKELYSN